MLAFQVNYRIREKPSSLNAAQTIGCGLRAFLEPSELFLRQLSIPFQVGTSPAILKTIEEIKQFFEENYVRINQGIQQYNIT